MHRGLDDVRGVDGDWEWDGIVMRLVVMILAATREQGNQSDLLQHVQVDAGRQAAGHDEEETDVGRWSPHPLWLLLLSLYTKGCRVAGDLSSFLSQMKVEPFRPQDKQMCTQMKGKWDGEVVRGFYMRGTLLIPCLGCASHFLIFVFGFREEGGGVCVDRVSRVIVFVIP